LLGQNLIWNLKWSFWNWIQKRRNGYGKHCTIFRKSKIQINKPIT